MHKFPITEYKKFSDLPLDRLNTVKFSVYIIDFNWNYLFVNDFAKNNLRDRGTNLVGMNMWDVFHELRTDPGFNLLKKNSEKGITSNIILTSPVTGQRLNITGFPLEDCYYFTSSILPDKGNLIDELRNELAKKNKHD
ncbi:MAG TPA: hypothetical protein VFZ52_10015 [Chryseolinea sp.]